MNIGPSAAPLAALLVVAMCAPSHADDQSAAAGITFGDTAVDTLTLPRTERARPWEVSVGADHSRGTYGASRVTKAQHLSFGIAYRADTWRVSVDSGVLSVRGPLDYASLFDLAPEDLSDLGLEDDTDISGMADTTLAFTRSIYENFDAFVFVDVGVRVKIPTASRAKGLGDGKIAGDLHVDIVKMVGPWSLLGSVTYGFRHHNHGNRDTQSASAGVGRGLTDRLSIGAIYEWRRSPAPQGRDGHDLIGYATYRLSKRIFVTGYGVRGIAPNSVDLQAGLRLATRW